MARAQFSRYRALANWCQSRRQDRYTSEPSDLVSAHTTRLDSFWVQQLFLNNKLRVRAGQLAGLDFYGNQEYGGSWLIEPMGYAFGNLFSSIYESFNPAGTPGAEVRFAPTPMFYIKSAVM